jgi:hypothetical protein
MRVWEISKTNYKVSDFISWQRAKTLELSPSFQRRPVWKAGAKSFLVDSVVRGLPIPIIFLREQKTDLASLEPKREVVDGQQRIRTLLSFIDPSLLKDFNPQMDTFTVQEEHNKDLADKGFKEFPTHVRQQILDYQFSVHILPAQVDDREVLEIFARMNATGVKLNQQELRNAEFFGKFKTAMYQLATEQLYRWREWKIFSEYDIARMQEVELTSELALMMQRGITHKLQKAIDDVYEKKDKKFPERPYVISRYRTVMESLDDKLGRDMATLIFKARPLFYVLFTFIYDIQFGLGSPLEKKKAKPLPADAVSRVKFVSSRLHNKTAPEEVLEAVARRTTNAGSRLAILNYLKRY